MKVTNCDIVPEAYNIEIDLINRTRRESTIKEMSTKINLIYSINKSWRFFFLFEIE